MEIQGVGGQGSYLRNYRLGGIRVRIAPIPPLVWFFLLEIDGQ